jgi:hypothetical protein
VYHFKPTNNSVTQARQGCTFGGVAVHLLALIHDNQLAQSSECWGERENVR